MVNFSTVFWVIFAITLSTTASAKGKPANPGGGGDDVEGEADICVEKKVSVGTCGNSLLDTSYLTGYSWEFTEDFSQPAHPDEMEAVDYTLWSTRFPFGDWKNNTAGDEDVWYVNTTGLEPGIGWEGNHYPDMQTFLNELTDKPIFERVKCSECLEGDYALKIQAYKNPWKHRINQNNDNLSGVISSHSKPGTKFGLEYRYGYLEMRMKLPRQGNGFRVAGWAYGDNAFYNQVYTRPTVNELDMVEYLPGTRCANDADGIKDDILLQTDLFGANNTELTNWQTWDTIYHSFHSKQASNKRLGITGFDGRTPTSWHFNNESAYSDARCRVNHALSNSTDDPGTIDFGDPVTSYVTFGVLWEKDKIEWYIEGVPVHALLDGSATSKAAIVTYVGQTYEVDGISYPIPAISNTRKYIIANLGMGMPGFEGSVDDSVFEADGSGPAVLIDYIKLYQKDSMGPDEVTEDSHAYWCGLGKRDCNEQP